MIRSFVTACLTLALLPAADLVAQDSGSEGRMKSLTDEQVQAYLEGQGMGMGMAAEANGYPGPKHVLELADSLGLSEDQRQQTAAAFAQVRADAQRLGKEIVAEEQALDERFAAGTITEDALRSAVKRIGELKGELRYAHLRAHLGMAEILTAEQRQRYSELRGHAKGQGEQHRHQHGQLHQDTGRR